jgi:hypothetical protein
VGFIACVSCFCKWYIRLFKTYVGKLYKPISLDSVDELDTIVYIVSAGKFDLTELIACGGKFDINVVIVSASWM